MTTLPHVASVVKPAPDRDITLSPCYNSAVNSVTKPNRITHVSDYFIDRWMPLLRPTGTAIVLALRRSGFLNRKTGETRDEIVVSLSELAEAAGISADTLTREMGIDKKTGKHRNPALHKFVQKRAVSHRNRLGQLRQGENAYWVSMDDPVHDDDWHLVAAAVLAEEARKSKTPETHSASPVGAYHPQIAEPETQNAEGDPQSASRLKSYDSSRLKTTLQDAQSRPDWSSLPSERKEILRIRAEDELVLEFSKSGERLTHKDIEDRAITLYQRDTARDAFPVAG